MKKLTPTPHPFICLKSKLNKVHRISIKFKMMIFKYIGQRLKKRPRKCMSPFKVPCCHPKINLAKALAQRNKTVFGEKLK